MSKFDTPSERIFIERVVVYTSDLKYVEKGNDFVRFKDEEGRLFEVKVTEKRNKEKIKNL
jgi:hypothetical protein